MVTAPVHATAARIHLAAFGGAPAAFDDVVFRRAEGGAAPTLVSDELRVRIDAGGFLEAVRMDEVLLTQASIAPSVDAPVESLLGAALSGPPAHAGTALTAAGRSFGGAPFEWKAESAAAGATLTCVSGGGAGALAFTSPPAVARGAVTLVLEKTALVLPEQETFGQEGVRKIIVGTSEGPQPFVLSAAPGSPGFSFSSRRTARGLRVQLAPAAGAPQGADGASVLLSVDLSRENDAARDLLRKARDFETAGKKGSAAEAYERVALEDHYLPAFRKDAEEAAARILGDGRGRLAAAKALSRSAKRFRSAPDLRKVVEDGEALSKEYAEHPFGVEAGALAEEARRELESVREQAVEKGVERLYQRATDYVENRQVALALALHEEILRVAPEGNEFRAEAGKKVLELRPQVERQRLGLYGPRK